MATQQRLEGVEVSKIPGVDRTLSTYLEAVAARKEAKGLEDAARTKVIEAMKKAGVLSYDSEHFHVEVMPSERLKVKRVGDEAEEGAEE